MKPADRASERLRHPQPLIRKRLPSKRGATEQPNVTGDGDTPLSARFWAAVVVTGVASGFAGIAMMAVLTTVEHLAFDYHNSGIFDILQRTAGGMDFQSAVERTGDLRRLASLAVAGLVGGIAWYLLRRWAHGPAEVDDAIWSGDGHLAVGRSLGTSIISEMVVGMGASIGREAAPKLLGGVFGSVVADRLGLTVAQRRLLVACGAGAGLAAVYNVPLGGALFTAELLVGSLALPVVLPALFCAWIATATAWLYLPNAATYVDIPAYRFSVSILVWSLAAGGLVGAVASGYIRLIGWTSHHRVKGAWSIAAMIAVFAALGAIGIAYPQLFGNGKDMAHMAFVGHGGLLLLLALFALKPIVTSACLASGASGGLFTPTMSTGAVLGGFLGLAWSHLWPGSPEGAFALVGATAMIGATMQAPLAAIALVVELTQGSFGLMVPMIAATVIATTVARHVDGYSIYSARLPARATSTEPARPGHGRGATGVSNSPPVEPPTRSSAATVR